MKDNTSASDLSISAGKLGKLHAQLIGDLATAIRQPPVYPAKTVLIIARTI